jgi:hypothetical protein
LIGIWLNLEKLEKNQIRDGEMREEGGGRRDNSRKKSMQRW